MPSEFEQAVSRFRRHSAALSALDRLKIRPWHWLTAVVLALGADLITPPSFYFRPLFLIGVLLAAWGSGRAAGVALAVSMPLANLATSSSERPACAARAASATTKPRPRDVSWESMTMTRQTS